MCLFLVVLGSPALSVLSANESSRITPAVRAVSLAMQSTVTIQSRDFYVAGKTKGFKAAIKNLGCGMVVEESGLVLTNYHVVAEQKHLRVSFFDGRDYCAKLLYQDEANDLALIQIRYKGDEKFSVAKFAFPGDLYLAESVLAIGNPQGLEFSVTDGIVSSLNRTLKVGSRVIHEKLIQISAKANPGNSGGPVINLNGETVGLFLATKTATQGIGFVLPIQKVIEVLGQWLSPEYQRKAELGFDVVTEFNKKTRVAQAVVTNIQKTSANHLVGINDDLAILKVNNVKIHTALDFYRQILKANEGELIQLGLSSGKSIKVRLQPLKGLNLAKVKLGLGLEPLGRDLARAVAIPFDQGFVLTETDLLGSFVPKIQRGDMLFKIGDEIVVTNESLQKVIMNAKRGKKLQVVFFRVKEGEGKSFVETVNDTIVVR